MGRGSVVSLATGHRLDSQGFKSRWGKNFCNTSTRLSAVQNTQHPVLNITYKPGKDMEGGDCGLTLGTALPLEIALRDSENNKNIRMVSLSDEIQIRRP
jgi:hypothetical protein